MTTGPSAMRLDGQSGLLASHEAFPLALTVSENLPLTWPVLFVFLLYRSSTTTSRHNCGSGTKFSGNPYSATPILRI